MIRIGELCQKNEFTIAQEHLATAITQSVMSSVYYIVFGKGEKIKKGNFLLTCPVNELHEMGARMLADLLEIYGWDVRYLGAIMPSLSVIEIMQQEQPYILGVSCTMTFNLKYAKELIQKVRLEYEKNIPIIVGGMIFNIDASLVNLVGADYHGRDFKSTIEKLNAIILKGDESYAVAE